MSIIPNHTTTSSARESASASAAASEEDGYGTVRASVWNPSSQGAAIACVHAWQGWQGCAGTSWQHMRAAKDHVKLFSLFQLLYYFDIAVARTYIGGKRATSTPPPNLGGITANLPANVNTKSRLAF